jgi:ParB family chromosome partitioning protein
MKMVAVPPHRQLYERRLGRTLLRAYRDTVDLYSLVPNNQQPRRGPKEDPELQRQIEANEGIFEPLLVEPHPELGGKLRIIDGDRRWTNSKLLVEVQKKEQFRTLPVEVTERTLTDDERLRVWVYIHRQRKEWDAREKEMVAYNLVDLVGRASAANILGITVRALDKLVDVFELSEKLKGIPDPNAAITWAREINSLSKKLLTPTVRDTLIRRINEKQVTNSKDIRKLRQVLRDPVARDSFLDHGKSIEAALLRVAPKPDAKAKGLAGDIEALSEAIQRQPWTELSKMKGNSELISKITEVEHLLADLRNALVTHD